MSLNYFTQKDINKYTSVREGETKFGQIVSFGKKYKNKNIQYVIIGVPEDIGPQANCGNAGAKNSWNAFLSIFLNMQHNQFNNSNKIHIKGTVKVADIYLKLKQNPEDISFKRTLVEQIDERVKKAVLTILKDNKIPIVIGGGHNNCYPIINATSTYFKQKVNVLNIDPHADLRTTAEGRHSGNGFSKAIEQNYLKKYFVLGLHKQYNSQFIFNYINKNKQITYYPFEKIIEKENVSGALKNAFQFFKKLDGLEIDLDVIKSMPVSAYTPSGLTVEKVRKITMKLAKKYQLKYLHVCEGAPKTTAENKIVGKTIAYLVLDFIQYSSKESTNL